jgi:hypothetical protein
MGKNTITITESELKNMIMEAVEDALVNEEDNLEEGLLGQFGDASKTFFSRDNAGKGLSGRFQAAKKNYATRGELDKLTALRDELKQFVADKELDPNMTIGQLIGGGYRNPGRFASLIGNRKSQMTKRGL